jgi:membrane associated rhomboid family serine protease
MIIYDFSRLKNFPTKSVASRYSFGEDSDGKSSAGDKKKGNSGDIQLAALGSVSTLNHSTVSNLASQPMEDNLRPRRSTFLGATKKQSLASLRASKMLSKSNLRGSKDALLGIPQVEEIDKMQVEIETVKFRPIAMYFLLGINCLMFFIMMCVDSWEFENVSLNPTFGPSASFLLSFGAKLTVLEVEYGQAWRLISSMFLHAGFVHLILNMWTFYRIGADVEEYCGKFILIFVYILSGLSGQISSSVFNPRLIGVGASGAIYGLLGLLFGDFLQNHQTIVEEKWKYFASLVFSLIFGFVIGLLPIVDNWYDFVIFFLNFVKPFRAHMGGFLMGFLLGVLLLTNDEMDDSGKRLLPWYSNMARVIALSLSLLWMISMLIILFKTGNGNVLCSWCKYLDCFNTPWWTCPDQV